MNHAEAKKVIQRVRKDLRVYEEAGDALEAALGAEEMVAIARERTAELEQERSELEGTKGALQAEIGTLEAKLAAMRSALAKQRTAAEAECRDIEEKCKANRVLVKELEEEAAELSKKLFARADELKAEVLALRNEKAELQDWIRKVKEVRE